VLHLGNNTADGSKLTIDPSELCTHAVVVGMTGSGKTGLVVALLEELLAAKIPAIAIDPKGDLANLKLQLRTAEDFVAWGGKPEQEVRYTQAIEDWQIHARSHRLSTLCERVTVYTPASSVGAPISALRSFDAPHADNATLEESEERLASTTSALLALLGMRATPHQSHAHALISTLIAHAWDNGDGVDLDTLVEQIVEPPCEWIGVQDIDDYMSLRKRRNLASKLNTLLASPRFACWLRGEPINIESMLYQNGEPRVAIVSLAHLSESERQFFITLLLSEYLAYMRTLPGSDTLKAALVIDECVGYIPPVREPSSKRPLLTLLKQARAYGTGVVLATQNPVDLDYKALSNAGTWFVGRLQTERDKARLLAGMPHSQGVERMLSGLGKRCFAVHSVKQAELRRLLVRQTCSYLRGPLTRLELRKLTGTPDSAGEPSKAAQIALLERRYEAVLASMQRVQDEGRARAGTKMLPSLITAVAGNKYLRARALGNSLPQATTSERAKLERCKRQLAALESKLHALYGDNRVLDQALNREGTHE